MRPLIGIAPAFLLISSLAADDGNAAKAKPPNVVIFLADDAGWGDYGQSGNHQVATPHIDSIAVEGVSLGTLVERLGRLSDARMRQICDALEIAVACEA